MGELARRYPPGTLIVSTGQHPNSSAVDQQFPNRVDRLSARSRRLRTLQGTFHWFRRVTALAGTVPVSFIWCGNLKPAAYPARWAKKWIGIPYGVMLHGRDLLILQDQVRRSYLKRRAARALLRQASALVTNSSWTADLCRAVLAEIQIDAGSDLIRVVPLGADPVSFRPGLNSSEIRERYALQGRRWLLSVARLTRHKGLDSGIRALADLGSTYPDLGYIIVGSGEDSAYLSGLSHSLGVADRVRILSGVPDADLPGLYNCAQVYLGLSRLMERQVEGFGISLVEASACGLPVLAGRTGGIPDAVRHDETGLLVEVERPEEIRAALRRLLDEPGLAVRLGEAGRRAVESYYNWDRVTADIARIGGELGIELPVEAVPR
jgi:phosphatidylinositol alpha-1,6-mannosyltransferase